MGNEIDAINDVLRGEDEEEDRVAIQDFEDMFQEADFLDMLEYSSSDDDDESVGEQIRNVCEGGESKERDDEDGEREGHMAGGAGAQHEDVPIAQRTRAHGGYPESELKQLDDAIEGSEEILFGNDIDDVQEYEKFLSMLREPADGLENHEEQLSGKHDESEDDEDFILELKQMLEDQAEEQYFRNINCLLSENLPLSSEMRLEKIGKVLGRGEQSVVPKTKPTRRSRRIPGRQRQLYAAKLATKRKLELNNQYSVSRYYDAKDLNALAVVMAGGSNGVVGHLEHVPLPSEFEPGMYDKIANGVEWRPPLPNVVRRAHKKMMASVGTAAHGMAPFDFPGDSQYMMGDQLEILREQCRQHIQVTLQLLFLAVMNQDAMIVQGVLDSLVSFLKSICETVLMYPTRVGCNRIDARFSEVIVEESLLQVENLEQRFRPFEFIPASISDVLVSLMPIGAAVRLPRNPLLERSAVNKRFKKNTGHEIWMNLPLNVIDKLAICRVRFDERLEPRAPDFASSKQMKFVPAEDALLAWGIRKHGYNWSKIREEFLPTKPEKTLFNRKKNKISSDYENAIRDVTRCITMPLTVAEIRLLHQATQYYGKQSGKWEQICKEHLPYRNPFFLAMLWSKHKNHKENDRESVP